MSRASSPAAPAVVRDRGYWLTLTEGDLFNKYKHKRSVRRFLWVDRKLENLCWQNPDTGRNSLAESLKPKSNSKEESKPAEDDAEDARNSVPLHDLLEIVLEPTKCTSDCEVFVKRFTANPTCCLSLKFKSRTIDLEATSKNIRDDWATALFQVFLSGRSKDDFLAFDDNADDVGGAQNSMLSSMELSPSDDFKSPNPSMLKSMASMDNLDEELKGEAFATILAKGANFKKYKKGGQKERYIWTDGKMKKLYWGIRSAPGKRKVKGTINIDEIDEINTDPAKSVSECPLFAKRLQAAPELCLSIVHAHRTIDLEAEDEVFRNKFVKALQDMVVWRDNRQGGDEYVRKRKIKTVLTKGATFIKYTEKKGQDRWFWVDTRLEHLYWGEKKAVVNKSTGKFRPHKAKGAILIDDIRKIVTKKEELETDSKILDRFATNEELCISIDSEGRFLDIEAGSKEQREQWVASLKAIVALGHGSSKKKPFIFDGEEGNEDLTDEDEGKEINDVDSDEEPLNLPKIKVNFAENDKKKKAQKPEEKKELLQENPIAIDRAVEDLLMDLQADLEADRVVLYKADGSRLRAAWVEGASDSSALSGLACTIGEGVLGKLAGSKGSGDEAVVVLPDAYENSKFEKGFDESFKYRTTSLLALRFQGGVLCFLNKQDFQYKKDYFQSKHVQQARSKLEQLQSLLKW